MYNLHIKKEIKKINIQNAQKECLGKNKIDGMIQENPDVQKTILDSN